MGQKHVFSSAELGSFGTIQQLGEGVCTCAAAGQWELSLCWDQAAGSFTHAMVRQWGALPKGWLEEAAVPGF